MALKSSSVLYPTSQCEMFTAIQATLISGFYELRSGCVLMVSDGTEHEQVTDRETEINQPGLAACGKPWPVTPGDTRPVLPGSGMTELPG